MDGLANGADTLVCPHCGEEMRRGMVRCRQCGKTASESPSDFELSGHELVRTEESRCALCDGVLDPGTDDCPACTSALLDQLLKGPEESPVPAPHSGGPLPSSAAAELRVRRARMAPPGGNHAADNGKESIESSTPVAAGQRQSVKTRQT